MNFSFTMAYAVTMSTSYALCRFDGSSFAPSSLLLLALMLILCPGSKYPVEPARSPRDGLECSRTQLSIPGSAD